MIALSCAKRIRVSDELRVVDSTLSVDSADFGGGGLRSSGNCPLSFRCASWGGGGFDNDDDDNSNIRRRQATGAADDASLETMTTARTVHVHEDNRTRTDETMIYADPRDRRGNDDDKYVRRLKNKNDEMTMTRANTLGRRGRDEECAPASN